MGLQADVLDNKCPYKWKRGRKQSQRSDVMREAGGQS